ncbi:MAG TPA: hypothetical protein VFN42_07475 [Acetobacteraceae bacterium]|nr:hypothetical protein [Acetobacteraceae bacterium]
MSLASAAQLWSTPGMGKFDGIASLAARIIRSARQQATGGLARSGEVAQRVKAEAVTRRGMMDAALREKRAKRGK